MKNNYSLENINAFVKYCKNEYDGSRVFGPMYALWWIEICCLLITTNNHFRVWVIILTTPFNIIVTLVTVLYFMKKTLFNQNLYLALLYLISAYMSVILSITIIDEFLNTNYQIFIIFLSIIFAINIIINIVLIKKNLTNGMYLQKKKRLSQEQVFGICGGLSAIITHALLPQFSVNSQVYVAIVIVYVASCFCVATSTGSFIRVYFQKKYQIDEIILVKQKKNEQHPI